jgi:hypothetical protein
MIDEKQDDFLGVSFGLLMSSPPLKPPYFEEENQLY